MNAGTVFERHHPRLFNLAYRLLGVRCAANCRQMVHRARTRLQAGTAALPGQVAEITMAVVVTNAWDRFSVGLQAQLP